MVRDFFIHNALYWLEEYRFDGLRLDAVHAIVDDAAPDFLTELAQTVRERFGTLRFVHLVVENVDNTTRYLSRAPTGRARLYNAQWNDDIHHALHVLLTGESDGYYADYFPDPTSHLGRSLAEGFAYQGEYSAFHGEKRGERSNHLPPTAFVSFLQNHDQVGNRAFGERITELAAPQEVKMAMEILLLAPEPPLLFMGEEFGATTPFLFFCDFQRDLADAVTKGRRNEFAHFAKFGSLDARESIPDPNAESTYLKSKLDWGSLRERVHSDWLCLYRELLALRQSKIVPHLGGFVATRRDTSTGSKRWVSVDWIFTHGATLELRANLGSESMMIAARNAETPLYSSSPEVGDGIRQGSLSPWSVVWFLAS